MVIATSRIKNSYAHTPERRIKQRRMEQRQAPHRRPAHIAGARAGIAVMAALLMFGDVFRCQLLGPAPPVRT
jgi:hypothetical protein